MAVHRYLSERCLRTQKGGYMAPEVKVNPEVMKASPEGTLSTFLNWIGDDARFIPASEINEQLKGPCPMLQLDEFVEQAYKSGRDMLVFTSKRVLVIDTQGFTGKKVEYKSVPYPSIRAFTVCSAGSWDRDAEVSMVTRTHWSDTISQDMRKGKCDIIAIQSFLAAQIIGAQDGSSNLVKLSPVNTAPAPPPTGVDAFLKWLGDSAYERPKEEVEQQFRSDPHILQHDETVEKAYRCGRDLTIFTTKRIIFVDVQGWSGARVQYQSYPLQFCKGFEVQSAGMQIPFFNSHPAHAGIYMLTRNGKLKQCLNDSILDIFDLQAHFMAKLLDPH